MNGTKLELMLQAAKRNYVEISGVHYNPNNGYSQAAVIADAGKREYAIFYLGQIKALEKLVK